VGWCYGPLKSSRFFRQGFTVEGFEAWLRQHLGRLDQLNLLMGVGFWVDPSRLEPEPSLVLYDRVVYDFDSEVDPGKAVEAALRFSNSISSRYGTTPVVFRSGFKGAHVVIPLARPTDWEGYQLLWQHFLTLLTKEHRNLVDRNMLQWNRLDRVPYTWNVKEKGKALAEVIHPEGFDPRAFSWASLRPLDPGTVTVYKVVLPESPRPRTRAGANPRARVRWIEEVLERGLPDGRKRLLALAIIPYLVNVLRLGDAEAEARVRGFLEACCRNYGRCEEVGARWIQYEIRRIRERGYGPIRYEKLAERYRDLYDLVRTSLGGA